MLKKATINWSTKILTNQIKKGNVFFECSIQRGVVWDNSRNSLLIHSLIEGYPVPALYFQKADNGEYIALDGKQRSTAISGYLSGDYALCDNFEIVTDDNGDEHDFSGLKYEQLPEFARDAIKDYTLTIHYFENLTDEERDSLFYRLNNGKPLTAIELTRVKAKSLEKFQELTKHELINISVTEKGRIKYNHENLTMQAWAACFAGDNFSFETKPFRELIESAEVTEEQTEIIKNCFDILLEVYNSYDTENKKEKAQQKRITTRTHLVSLTKTIYTAITNGCDIEQLKKWIKYFFTGTKGASISTVYNESCGAGSAKRDNVEKRMNAIINSMIENVKITEIQKEQTESIEKEPAKAIQMIISDINTEKIKPSYQDILKQL